MEVIKVENVVNEGNMSDVVIKDITFANGVMIRIATPSSEDSKEGEGYYMILLVRAGKTYTLDEGSGAITYDEKPLIATEEEIKARKYARENIDALLALEASATKKWTEENGSGNLAAALLRDNPVPTRYKVIQYLPNDEELTLISTFDKKRAFEMFEMLINTPANVAVFEEEKCLDSSEKRSTSCDHVFKIIE